jgi:hypothetical protein
MSLSSLSQDLTVKDDPLDAVHAYVERAYIRLQAGEVIMRCMDTGSSVPLQQMVEGLILAGPQSLSVLREMLAESGQRKLQVIDDLHQVFSDLQKNLTQYGVHLAGLKGAVSIPGLTQAGFLIMLQEQGVTDEEVQTVCLRILKESRELMESMSGNVVLLEEIETYLADWLWGLAYECAHQALGELGCYLV